MSVWSLGYPFAQVLHQLAQRQLSTQQSLAVYHHPPPQLQPLLVRPPLLQQPVHPPHYLLPVLASLELLFTYHLRLIPLEIIQLICQFQLQFAFLLLEAQDGPSLHEAEPDAQLIALFSHADDGPDAGNHVPVGQILGSDLGQLIDQVLEILGAVLAVGDFIDDCNDPSFHGVLALAVWYRQNLSFAHFAVGLAHLAVRGNHSFGDLAAAAPGGYVEVALRVTELLPGAGLIQSFEAEADEGTLLLGLLGREVVVELIGVDRERIGRSGGTASERPQLLRQGDDGQGVVIEGRGALFLHFRTQLFVIMGRGQLVQLARGGLQSAGRGLAGRLEHLGAVGAAVRGAEGGDVDFTQGLGCHYYFQQSH